MDTILNSIFNVCHPLISVIDYYFILITLLYDIIFGTVTPEREIKIT